MPFFNPQTDPDGTPLFWNRRSIDGAPFRGKEILALRQDELERHSVLVHDVYNGYFDTTTPDQKNFNMTYREVLQAHYRGQGRVLFRHKFILRRKKQHPKIVWYVEWSMPFVELGDDPEIIRRKQDSIITISPQGLPQQG